MKEGAALHDSPSQQQQQQQQQQQHDNGSKVMLPRPSSPWQTPPLYSNISAGNGSQVLQVKTADNVYKSLVSSNGQATSGDLLNTTTISYEQLSKEFYQSYDPSIGLHTAAVLGGILVWLVLYLIYRTKVRKWVLDLFKKQLTSKEELGWDQESKGGGKASMVRPLINPSIVIEASPPESLPQSPGSYDPSTGPDCPRSLAVVDINEDGMVFQFPCPGLAGSQQQLHHYHQPYCSETPDIYLQLPKSEVDIPSATAQWVQSMPLAARSHQDFANLMLSLQSRGLLAMHKPCSCPLVCPKSPSQALPLLDLPNSWNKSLPVLSNSLSSQLLSAYETATTNHNNDKEIKDFIKASRKLNKHRQRRSVDRECVAVVEKHAHSLNYNRRQACMDERSDSSQIKKSPPNLTIHIPDTSTHFSRSPVPIPVTPTVMIQTSKPVYRHRYGCESNTSVSSSSSFELLLAPPPPPPPQTSSRHYHERIPSPHLLSPTCDQMKRPGSSCLYAKQSCRFSGQCSFKYQGRDDGRHAIRRHSSLGDSHVTNNNNCQHLQSALTRQHRSLSDYNTYLTGCQSPAAELILHQASPTYSRESNKTHSPSPHLLQVPELAANLLRPLILDFGPSSNTKQPQYQLSLYKNGNQPMRHCVHSDSNIAYHADQLCPVDPTARRHSTIITGSGELNLSFCGDNTVRASSSCGSTSSYNSPHQHPHLPHHHHHHHPHDEQHKRHHSTGMLLLDEHNMLQAQARLNRSYSAVMMETKL